MTEQLFLCSHCKYEESRTDASGSNKCPKCGCEMTAMATIGGNSE